MVRNIITGIDIGSSTIQISVAEKKNGGLNILTVNEKKSEGVKNGYIISMDEAVKSIQRAVASAEKITNRTIRRAIISIGGISLSSAKSKGSIMISKADGEVSDYDVKRVISQSESSLSNISNKQIIQSIPLSFKIDGSLVMGKPVGMKGTKLEVETLSITCLSQHLSDLIKTVETAGIVIDDIVPSPLARSYGVLTAQQKEVGCVLVDIGASTVSIVVFEDGTPASLEVFPIGSTHITNDIALGFQVSLAEAEKLKYNFGADISVSKRRLSEIIEARLNDIFELIENHLKKINRHGVLPGGIILTGGGSSLFSLEEIARACLRIPSKIGAIGENEALSISAPSNIKDEILNNPGWSTVIGLCIMDSIDTPAGFGKSRWKLGRKIKQFFSKLIP